MKTVKSFWFDESGATAIEYGLIVGMIAVGLIATLTAMSTALTTPLDYVRDQLAAIVK